MRFFTLGSAIVARETLLGQKSFALRGLQLGRGLGGGVGLGWVGLGNILIK